MQPAGGREKRGKELTMKKCWTTLEEAEVQYTAITGKVPELSEMCDLYHRYRNEWKGFDGFHDWLTYPLEEVA